MIPTVWSSLFDCEALPVEAGRRIEQSPELEALHREIQGEVDVTFWDSARAAIGDGLRQMLSVSLLDVLVPAWATHPGLKRQISLGDPNRITLFELGEHEITSRHKPRIDIRSESGVLGTLGFELDLTLMLQLARLQIQAGRLVRATLGACRGSGRLMLGTVEIASFRSSEVPMPAQVSLGAGIVIPGALDLSTASEHRS